MLTYLPALFNTHWQQRLLVHVGAPVDSMRDLQAYADSPNLIHPPGLPAAREFLKRAITPRPGGQNGAAQPAEQHSYPAPGLFQQPIETNAEGGVGRNEPAYSWICWPQPFRHERGT